MSGLNDAQQKAVTHGQGPLLIVAGAGTGKTTVLTRRYAYLLQNTKRVVPRTSCLVPGTKYEVPGTPDSARLTTDNILALTFTDKAAGEMEDRVLQLLPNGAYDFWIGTFHGICQRILEQYGLEIGLPTHFRLVTETDGWLLMRRHLNELPLDYYRPLGNPVKFLNELLRHFSRAKDEGVTPERYVRFAQELTLDGDEESATGEKARLTEIAGCYAMYQKILRDEGALDFGDLIMETLRLLRDRPRVLAELRKQFAYVLVDEFQDTNWAQYELIKLLGGPGRNITVVGDDDQAIYKFRGASLANILQFRDDFPDAVTVSLTDNYRSRQEILDAAYACITKNNPNRLEVKLKDTGLDKRLTSAGGNGGTVDLQWYRSVDDEAEGVARCIMELKSESPDLRWGDIAILSRSNDGALPFVRALDRNRVPFRFYALRGLYAKPLVVDLTALFSLLDGYREPSAVWRVMTSPWYGIPTPDIAAFIRYAEQKTYRSLWDALTQARIVPGISPETVARTEVLVSHVRALAETAIRETPMRTLQRAIEKTEAVKRLMALPEAEKIEAVSVLNAFADRIRRYELSTHAPTLRGFMEEFRLEIESGEEGALDADPDQGPDMVKILTVHASKGLEFEHVFVVSMVEQRFPTRPRPEPIPLPDGLINERLPEGDAHLEEERRLFYVAVTRAKRGVILTGAESYGGVRKKKPSAFIAELGLDASSLEPQVTSGLLSVASFDVAEEAPDTPRETYDLKRRFSFTQLAAFRSCPLQYKFAHVYKIPILGSYQKSFGQCVHLTLQDILKLHLDRGRASQGNLFVASGPVQHEGFRVTLDEALDVFELRWAENDDWYEDKAKHDEYHAKGRSAVRRMVESWLTSPPDAVHLEKTFLWQFGDLSIGGKIDRMDKAADGSFVLFDYKTGSPKTSEKLETKDKEQLWIYQMAQEKAGAAVSGLTYVYVMTGDTADVPILTGDKRLTFEENMLERMRTILRSRFEPEPDPHVCRYCDFRNICEFKKL